MVEHVFHYKLEENGKQQYKDAVLELIRSQIGNLLDIAILTYGGRELNVDGFKLLSDRASIYDIRDSGENSSSPSLGSIVLYEPRIEFIKRQLESLLSIVELESNGAVVHIDGFRLKNLSHWLTPGSGDPSQILDYAASRCNCDCVMCYNKGNPPSLALQDRRRAPVEELNEIKTRLKYFSPFKGTSLFHGLGCSYEVLAHPYFIEILHSLREKTSMPLRITTNGKNLTPRMINELANSQPIYLYLSLNSSSPERRKQLMKDDEPQVAISAPKLLADKGIPYAIVIVPWPIDSVAEMCDDLYKTAIYADDCGAHLIEVNLPGYSRWFSQREIFNLDEVWKACVSVIRGLREEIKCPIVAMPTMYEENLYEERKNLPRIIGLIRNSPAARSGLKRGDIITGINNIRLKTRPQARDILYMLQKTTHKLVNCTIQRQKQELELTINLDDFDYPFSKEFDKHLGVIFMGTGLRMSYIERLKEIVDDHKAKRVLFLSSTLVKPTFEQCLRESRLLSSSELELSIEVPRNNYFGGNIFMGDLLVVQDFIDHIKEYLSREPKPDLIVIPSSPFALGGWKRDLTGRVYLDIEREVGIPVALLECETIYD